jgi:hypothetical protein
MEVKSALTLDFRSSEEIRGTRRAEGQRGGEE